jgi:hypothetical protein
MEFKSLVVLALASTVGAERFGLNNGWLKNARISTHASVSDCKLSGGVQSLNLGSTFETDLNDETVVSVDYDYNDLNNGDLPKEVNVKWASGDYAVDADINLQDKSAKAEVTLNTGGNAYTAHIDTAAANVVTSAEGTFNVDAGGNNVVLTPSWDVAEGKGHVKATADINSNMKAEVAADMNSDPAFTVRVDYTVNDENSVGIEVDRSGSMTYEYTRTLKGGSEVVANFEPDKNIAIEWKDSAARGAWTTNVNVPWGNAAGSDISFKRSFDL